MAGAERWSDRLGLASCRRLVQEHHGTFQVSSAPGKGTTVSLLLPVRFGTNVDRLRSAGLAE